jgi:hypothetical protein
MEYTFKKVTLSEYERLWLTEVYQSQEFDVKKTKVKLYGQIPKNFDARQIDQHLYRYDHLTLVGIWKIDPKSKVFSDVAQVISKIKEMILRSPGIDRVSAVDLSKNTGLQEHDVEVALWLMADLGDFRGGASGNSNNSGYSSLTFPPGDNGYDAYLAYENLNDLMEEFYTWKPPIKSGGAEANWLPPISMSEVMAGEEGKQKLNTAFIIMPIDSNNPDLEDVHNAFKETCGKFGISAVRADEIEHQKQITDVVLQQIRECEFLIADLSYARPNVYYEIGYAHAIGKHPILFRKKGTPLHFDLSVHNAPEFQNVTELKKKLESRFEEILGRKAK